MVATSGARLLPEEAVQNLCQKLLPLTTILTPNIPEARLLLQQSGKPSKDVEDVEDIIGLARAVRSLGPKHVLVKGGHLPLASRGTSNPGEQRIVNVLVSETEMLILENSYLKSRNTHGTGCSLACEFGNTW